MYEGRRKNKVAEFEVLPQFLRDNLAAYLGQYGQIPSVTSESINRVWNFEIMLGHKSYSSIPNCLDVAGQEIPVIVTDKKSTYWTCWESGHHPSSCPKKVSAVLTSTDKNPHLGESVKSASTVVVLPKIGTGVVKPRVAFVLRPPFSENPLPDACYRERILTRVVVWNMCWDKLKSKIISFVADYSCRRNLVKLTAHVWKNEIVR